jgi:tetratricopeptide (TPR) repeat protein
VSQVPKPAASRSALGPAVALLALATLAGGSYFLFRGNASPANATPNTTATTTPDSKKIDAILNSARQYTQSGEPRKAEAILQAAVTEMANEQSLRLELGKLLISQNRPADASEQFEKALAIGPRDGEILMTAGSLASTLNKLELAAQHFTDAQSANPRNPEPSVFLAQTFIKLNKLDDAKTNLLLAVNVKPDLAVAWGSLADIALRENKPTIALQHIAKARELEPRVTVWRVLEARAHLRSNAPDKALELLTGLSNAERQEPGVLGAMSHALGMLKRPADAAALYLNAIDADPSRGEWAYEAALWLERAGDKPKALEYAKRAAILKAPHADELVVTLSK